MYRTLVIVIVVFVINVFSLCVCCSEPRVQEAELFVPVQGNPAGSGVLLQAWVRPQRDCVPRLVSTYSPNSQTTASNIHIIPQTKCSQTVYRSISYSVINAEDGNFDYMD